MISRHFYRFRFILLICFAHSFVYANGLYSIDAVEILPKTIQTISLGQKSCYHFLSSNFRNNNENKLVDLNWKSWSFQKNLNNDPSKISNTPFFSIAHVFYAPNKSSELDTCPNSRALADKFIHRVYKTWINDLSSLPRPNENWPSNRIDDELIQDYENTFRLMNRIGLNEISISGLFIFNSWHLDIERTIDQERTNQILRIIKAAHQHDIKVLSGLSVYSLEWDEIIETNLKLACKSNKSIICPNNPDAWNWQKRIIDYIFSFPIDGINIIITDHGRCKDCKELNALSDVAYHAVIINQVVEYVKKNYAEKLIGITSQGIDLGNPLDLPALKKMTKNVEYLIDVNKSALDSGNAHLCNVVNAIAPCFYGNLATCGIEPPLHWQRDRWFLPMIKRKSQYIQKSFEVGARAIENNMQLINNPGEEVSLMLASTLEQNPSTNWESILKIILNDLYQPKDTITLQYLAALFVKAEDIFFEQVQDENIPPEALTPESIAPPRYLKEKMSQEGMNDYKKNLCILRQIFNSLKVKINNPLKLDTILKCIDNIIEDINALTNNTSTCIQPHIKASIRTEEDQKLRVALSLLQKKGIVNVIIWNPESTHTAYLRLWNYYGKRINNISLELLNGNNEFSISETSLTPGFYYLEIIDSLFQKQECTKLVIE